MRRPLFLGLALILILSLLAACGEAAQPTAEPATSAPAPTEAMTEETTEGTASMSVLEQYAADHASGPGAIYLGDINQLVGPAPTVEQGDFDGNVTL
jgi:hypothetical protein